MGKEVIINKIKTVAVNIRKKLDISQNAYSKIELGYTKITLERLYQIAQILDVDLIELIKADSTNVERFINMPSAVSA
jgi:transcriptional regulator with XRE-family HTH domain